MSQSHRYQGCSTSYCTVLIKEGRPTTECRGLSVGVCGCPWHTHMAQEGLHPISSFGGLSLRRPGRCLRILGLGRVFGVIMGNAISSEVLKADQLGHLRFLYLHSWCPYFHRRSWGRDCGLRSHTSLHNPTVGRPEIRESRGTADAA